MLAIPVKSTMRRSPLSGWWVESRNTSIEAETSKNVSMSDTVSSSAIANALPSSK